MVAPTESANKIELCILAPRYFPLTYGKLSYVTITRTALNGRKSRQRNSSVCPNRFREQTVLMEGGVMRHSSQCFCWQVPPASGIIRTILFLSWTEISNIKIETGLLFSSEMKMGGLLFYFPGSSYFWGLCLSTDDSLWKWLKRRWLLRKIVTMAKYDNQWCKKVFL